ncbi:MAG: hypothetical protein H6622_04510 [Halobacteriovoraceae bacterium]|nr:hypothetical protein [Halobacteriovoraceae bacterium]
MRVIFFSILMIISTLASAELEGPPVPKEITLEQMLVKDPEIKKLVENDCATEEKWNEVCTKQNVEHSQENCIYQLLDLNGRDKLEAIIKKYLSYKKSQEKNTSSTGEQKDQIAFHDTSIPGHEIVTDPDFDKLNKYLSDKIAKAFYGDQEALKKAGQVKITDHKNFNQLYIGTMTKAILSNISSYCLFADPQNNFKYADTSDPKKRDSNKKFNISLLQTECSDETLQNVSAKFSSDRCKAPTGDIKSTAAAIWDECMINIVLICQKRENYSGVDNISNQKACAVVNTIKEIRTNLDVAGEVDFMLNIARGGVGVGASNIHSYNYGRENNEDGLDELSSLSSNEVAKNAKFDELKEKQIKLLDTCKAAAEQNAKTAKEIPECKEILGNDYMVDRLKEMELEAKLKTKIQLRKIAEVDKNDKEAVVEYLKKDGRSDDEIKKLFKKFGDDPKVLMEKVESYYKAEKEAILDEIKNKIKKKTLGLNEGDSIDNDQFEIIRNEIENKGDDYKALAHYNNIVSGYLSIGGGENSTGNYMSIQRELKDSAYDPSKSQDPASTDVSPEHFNLVKKTSGDEGDKASNKSSLTVDRKNINSILHYYKGENGQNDEKQNGAH